jgi:hypothetical protein
MAQTYFAQTLITDAARTIQAIASGETLNGAELSDGLISLNKLVDQWASLGLLIMQITEGQINLAGAAQPYALGYRPSKITAAYCDSGALQAPVEILSPAQWSEIVDNSRSGKFATKLFCDYASPNSNIFWWPTATGTLHLFYFAALAQWPDLAVTAITLAPGYARGLTLNLAVDLAEQYGKAVPQTLMAAAQQSKSDIALANSRIFGSDPPPDQPQQQSPGKQAAQGA